MNNTTIVCKDCGKDYTYESRPGRPSVRCEGCKEKFLAENAVELTTTIICRDCGAKHTYPSRRGKPSVLCDACKKKVSTTVRKEDGMLRKESDVIVGDEVRQSIKEVVHQDNDASLPIEMACVKASDLEDASYQVFVGGGCGWMYRGEDEATAKVSYKRYCKYSKATFGHYGLQVVSLYVKGELVEQYDPRAVVQVEEELQSSEEQGNEEINGQEE